MHMNHLKRATNLEHKALEAELDLLREDLTLADYVGLLRRFQTFLEPWERRIAQLIEPEAPGFMASRQKSAWLASDLRDLSRIEDGREPVERVPLPELTTAAQALGSMYVIEGSTLGGQILTRHFARKLGVTPEWGGRYYSGYGNSTGAMWRGFGEIVETRPPHERDSMAEAAVATFRALRLWLVSAAVPTIAASIPTRETGAHARH